MRIDKLIKMLEDARTLYGDDVQCLVEDDLDGYIAKPPIDELAYEDREGYGKSILFLM